MHFLECRALPMMMMFFLVVAAATAGATSQICGRSVTNRMGPMRAGSLARARDHARERARELERASERVSQIFIERESGEEEPVASKNALEANGEEKIGAAQNNSVLDATDLPAIVTQVAGIPFWMPATCVTASSSHHANPCAPPAALHADTAAISRTAKTAAATSTHEQQAFSIWQALWLWSPHHISRDTLSCQAAAEGAGTGGVGGDGAARCGGGRQGYARGADFMDVAPVDLMPTRARVFCALVAASRCLLLPSSLLRLKHITALA
jgi:hypothetical protein